MKKISTLIVALMFGAGAFAQLPAYLPAWGLIAWFPFTGNVLDSSGNGHNGFPVGITPAAGRYGVPNTAYYFNGASDYIYVPPGTAGHETSTDITNSLTISAWVKSPNYFFSPSGQMQIYWRGDRTPAHDPHMLYVNGTDIRIRRDVDPGTISNEVGTSITALDTNYHMMTGTYDSGTSEYRIYLDGQLMNSATMYGMETYPTSTMYNIIGAVDSGTWQFFYGTIDEIGIWNRALTPCEVEALYYSLPSIVTHQPANDTVTVTGTAHFTITDVVPSTTYQWQENSGTGWVNLTNTSPYSGVTTATLTITPVTSSMTGRQYRCVPSSATCLTDTTNAGKLIVRPPAGINNIVTNELTVAPDPSNGTFRISGAFGADADAAIDIVNPIGQIIYSEPIAVRNGQINNIITLPDNAANGLYFLKVRSASTNMVLRVVVAR